MVSVGQYWCMVGVLVVGWKRGTNKTPLIPTGIKKFGNGFNGICNGNVLIRFFS